MSCVICKSTRRLAAVDENAVSFHQFPKEGALQKLWLKALKINTENWVWNKNKHVCSKHFDSKDYFVSVATSRKHLRPEAVPSVMLEPQLLKPIHEPTQQASKDISGASSVISPILSLPSTSMQNTSLPSTSSSMSDTISKEKALVKRNRKRKLHKTLQSSSSTSTGSSGKKRRVAVIKEIHSYSKSPNYLIRRNTCIKARQQGYRKKLYSARKKVTRLEKKVFHMENVITFLKKNSMSDSSIYHIDKTISDVPHLLMSRYLQNIRNGTVSHQQYPEPLRRFAATLQFYSSRAYEEVRKEFALALPDQSTIRKWFANIECDPGFLDISLDLLERKANEALSSGKELIVSVIIDEMSIKKQIQFDGKKMWGYVDVGIPIDNDQLDIAGEALFINVVCHVAPWKLPIGYFLIRSLSGSEKANLVKEALQRLKDRKIAVTSITCDGPSAHFTMMESLGCNLDVSDAGQKLNPCFLQDGNKYFGIFDACHMLKLIRNTWAFLKVIKNPDGELIKWDYITKLHSIQEEETLHLGNKISQRHIDFTNQIMKVSLAAQTLSQSVADAIKYLRVDMHHPEFAESEATENFILKFNRLFDILNTKSPFGKGNLSALRESNENEWRPFLDETVTYLLRCTNMSDRPLYLTRLKTPFVGFAITIRSICGIFDEFVKTERLKYLLTFKVSQDHLETFFCALRCRNGWNNNPTALQLKYSLRRLLLHTRIDARGGNCRVIDSTVVLNVPSKSGKFQENIDLSVVRKYGFTVEELVSDDENYETMTDYIPLSELGSDVVSYISGYVIRMLEKRKICPDCFYHGALGHENLDSCKLINRKNRGGLKSPSRAVVTICEETEKIIRRLMIVTDNRLPVETGFQKAFVLMISQKFYECYDVLFPVLLDHFLDCPIFEVGHQFLLIQNIVTCYVRIRFFNLAKRFTQKAQGKSIRNKLTKLILFNHQ